MDARVESRVATRSFGRANEAHVEIIDAVRGLAALLVAGFHCLEANWIGLPAYWQLDNGAVSVSSILALATWPFMYGSIGVPILFVVSGYVIHRRSAKQLATGALSFDQARFLLRRFIRIYPTLLAAIALTLICDHFTRTVLHKSTLGDNTLGDTGSLWALLVNIVSLQGALGPPFGSNVALWSLAYEVQFYAFYPLALAVRSRIGAAWMLVAAFGLSVLGYVVLARNGIGAFPTYFAAWWIGAYLADREAEAKTLPRWWPALPGLLIPAGCYFFSNQRPLLMFMAWSIGFAPVLAWLVQSRSRWAAVRTPLHQVGQFSYSIYAVHMPVIALANALLLAGSQSNNLGWSLGIAAIALLFGYAIFLVAERPSIGVLSKLPR